MKTNVAARTESPKTHEGGAAGRQKPLEELTRAVSTCLLWEPAFYEAGSDQAARIADLCAKVRPEELAALAVRARTDLKLRHVPLFLVRQMTRLHKGKLVGDTLTAVCQRPDEMTEFLALYWKDDPDQSLSAQVKRGLGLAFGKFNEYALAKWNRPTAVKLRDVLRLCRPKPKDAEQAALWKRVIAGELATPDTWEVALSTGADKKATWERLITEKKLGGMAMLMNLRNMLGAEVDRVLIRQGLETANFGRVLPYRFISAAKAAPDLEEAISVAMVRAIGQGTTLPGRTLYVIDISGSMRGPLAAKSTLDRIDAACGLAILLREVSEDVAIYATAGDDGRRRHATGKVPPRRGFALRDAIKTFNGKLGGGGIFLTQCMAYIAEHESEPFDRAIVLTDEQDCDLSREGASSKAKTLGAHNYILNVAGYKPGLAIEGRWTRISGWSERVVDWMMVEEGRAVQGDAQDE